MIFNCLVGSIYICSAVLIDRALSTYTKIYIYTYGDAE